MIGILKSNTVETDTWHYTAEGDFPPKLQIVQRIWCYFGNGYYDLCFYTGISDPEMCWESWTSYQDDDLDEHVYYAEKDVIAWTLLPSPKDHHAERWKRGVR